MSASAHTSTRDSRQSFAKPETLRRADRQPSAQPATKTAIATAEENKGTFDWGRSLGVPGLLA